MVFANNIGRDPRIQNKITPRENEIIIAKIIRVMIIHLNCMSCFDNQLIKIGKIKSNIANKLYALPPISIEEIELDATPLLISSIGTKTMLNKIIIINEVQIIFSEFDK